MGNNNVKVAGPIVITGGNGFVGRHLLHALQQSFPAVSLASWDQAEATVSAGVTQAVIDITAPATYQALLEQLQPAWVVHLAAIAPVGESFADPARVVAVNTTATRQLLEVIRVNSPQTRVLAVSSAEIYGQGGDTPLPELPLTAAHPHSPYGHSKLQMEHVIEKEFADMVVRARPFPHIGPGQRAGFVTADFASQIAAIEAGQQEPVITVGNLTAWRDFTDVRDVVRAYALLLQKGEMGEVYHVASGQAVQIQSLLNQLLHLSSVKIQVEQDAARLRPSDTPRLVGDATKLCQLTGWAPQIPLEQSLADILAWWREEQSK